MTIPNADRGLRALATFGILAASIAGCSGGPVAMNGPYELSIAAGLAPRLTADDAVAITWDYLARQTPEIAAPELHVPPHVSAVWAMRAGDARDVDGCIPWQTSRDVVWITKGVGDYLNLHDLAWSHAVTPTDDPAEIACEGPGPAGILVIDDATRRVLGVFPLIGDAYPHPNAEGAQMTLRDND